jgi:prepilin-type N-terminal cleavage/methylation domain-containing protein
MKRSGLHNDKGFTLIEMLITIVIAAILGTITFTYISASLTKNAQLLSQAKIAMDLQQVMENILADYNLNYKSNLTGIKAKIALPASQRLPPAGYGPYTLVYNDFVILVVRTPPLAEDNKILKVTIKNDLGEKLTILLTAQ